MEIFEWRGMDESRDLFENAIARTTISADYRYPIHKHIRFHEIVIVLEGELKHKINDCWIKQKTSDLLYIPSGSSHELRADQVDFLNLLIPLEWLENVGVHLPDENYRLLTLTEDEAKVLLVLFESYTVTTDSNLARIRYFSLALRIAEIIISSHNITKFSGPRPCWLDGAVAALASGDWNPVSVAELADLCHVSPAHLSRCWKIATGDRPVIYLRNLRLDRAARILTAMNITVADVAERCGFDSIGRFHALFKARYGVTPAAYRRARRTI